VRVGEGIIKRGEKWFPAGENLFWDLSGQCRMLEAEYAKSLYNLHL